MDISRGQLIVYLIYLIYVAIFYVHYLKYDMSYFTQHQHIPNTTGVPDQSVYTYFYFTINIVDYFSHLRWDVLLFYSIIRYDVFMAKDRTFQGAKCHNLPDLCILYIY